ncbi:MAG: hypothetical protein CMF25_05160 [Kangiellaceae bacterium]|jgi:glycosyltransferase involved in cell wall biosynthesis|nr:hypothetical protein [Kangiellaceae bacterium]|tara:strand:- start:5695 stop:6858 length:1164 start_codon:yes stop_codon:yes gene_type:complete
MRVVSVITSIGKNGVSKAVINLSQALSTEGHVVDVVVLEKHGIQEGEAGSFNIIPLTSGIGVSRHHPVIKWVRRFGRIFIGGLFFYKRYAKYKSAKLGALIEKNGYEVILLHCHYSKVLMQYLEHPRVFHVVHNKKSEQLKGDWWGASRVNHWVFASAIKRHRVIAVSQDVKDDLVVHFGKRSSEVPIIPNIYDFDEIRRLATQPFCSKKLIGHSKYIVAVGRLSQQKRFDWLIQAYALSNQQVPLLIIGDGTEKRRLIRLITTLGLARKVVLLDWVDNPYPYIKNALAMVLSSSYEGLPTVCIEASVLGTNIIATNCSGVSDIIQPGIGRVLVDVNDIGQMVGALNSQMATDKMIANDAIDNVTQRFEPGVILQRYFSLWLEGDDD